MPLAALCRRRVRDHAHITKLELHKRGGWPDLIDSAARELSRKLHYMESVKTKFLSWLSGQSMPARIARLPLRAIPGDTVVPVLSGTMCGAKWISGSFNQSCYLGGYEGSKQAIIKSSVRPGSVFYDIGANVGFYTVLASRLVGGTGKVVSFEPVPRNVTFLNRHIMINSICNATVCEAAVGESTGSAKFSLGERWAMGRLSHQGELNVALVSIDDCVARGMTPPNYMKIDVEGAEANVLRGATLTLAHSRPIIFLATHNEQAEAHCKHLLGEAKYRVSLLEPSEFVCEPIA